MNPIRPAREEDAVRVAEIRVFCYRLNFYPIFRDDDFYFRELTVPNAAQRLADDGFPENTLVYDDGAVKGFVTLDGEEIRKLFVEPCLWNEGIGSLLLEAAVSQGGRRLWALEKNVRAIRFYERHSFRLTGREKPVDDTAEMLVEMALEA